MDNNIYNNAKTIFKAVIRDSLWTQDIIQLSLPTGIPYSSMNNMNNMNSHSSICMNNNNHTTSVCIQLIMGDVAGGSSSTSMVR